MEPTNAAKPKLHERDSAKLQELVASGTHELVEMLRHTAETDPGCQITHSAIAGLIMLITAQIKQAFWQGIAQQCERQQEMLDRLREQRDLAMRLAEDSIAARERVLGGKMPNLEKNQ